MPHVTLNHLWIALYLVSVSSHFAMHWCRLHRCWAHRPIAVTRITLVMLLNFGISNVAACLTLPAICKFTGMPLPKCEDHMFLMAVDSFRYVYLIMLVVSRLTACHQFCVTLVVALFQFVGAWSWWLHHQMTESRAWQPQGFLQASGFQQPPKPATAAMECDTHLCHWVSGMADVLHGTLFSWQWSSLNQTTRISSFPFPPSTGQTSLMGLGVSTCFCTSLLVQQCFL